MSMFDFGSDTETKIASESADLVCQYPDCTVPLSYGGRGRRPVYCDMHKGGKESSSSRTNASSNTRRKSGAVPERELEQACNNLNTLYQSLLMPLMLVSQDGAQIWSDQIDRLDDSNHTFLANNKKLVRQINDSGEKGGTVGFVMAHVFAVTPVVLVCYADITRRGKAKTPPAPQPPFSPGRDGADFIDVPFEDMPFSHHDVTDFDPGPAGPDDVPVYDVDAAFRK